MNASLLKADTRESTTITLRFDPRMLARIKRVARSRYLNYQSMIKQWLSGAGWRKRAYRTYPSCRPFAALQNPRGIEARLALLERFPPVRSNDALHSSCSPILNFSPSAIANEALFSTGHAIGPSPRHLNARSRVIFFISHRTRPKMRGNASLGRGGN